MNAPDTPATALEACRVAFPHRDGLSVAGVNPLVSNQHILTVAHVKWEDDKGTRSEPVILRRYPSPLGWHTLDDPHRAARELTVLHHLRTNDFPVPPAYAIGTDESGDWLLIGVSSGRNWWLPFGLVNFSKVLPGITRRVVTLLARLHTLDVESLPTEDAHLPSITVAGMLGTVHEIVKSADDPDIQEAADRITALMADIEERSPRLINVDAQLTNVLVNPSHEITSWLDWDEAALGDPRWDVAALVGSLWGAYQLRELATWAATTYSQETIRPTKDITRWVALRAVLRWAQCVWLLSEIKQGREIAFPGFERFINAYDSHKAWAMETLVEAEAEV